MSIFQLRMHLQQRATMPLDEALQCVQWRKYFRQFEENGQRVPPEEIEAYRAFQRSCEERKRRDTASKK